MYMRTYVQPHQERWSFSSDFVTAYPANVTAEAVAPTFFSRRVSNLTEAENSGPFRRE